MTGLKNRNALIIVGQPKAGTTSIMSWFSGHPEFCASRVREARFFLDEGYPIPSGARYNGDNGADYIDHFPDPAARILLDSSPDYMFCKAPLALADLMPQARILIVKRDPVERMVSWFRYAAERGDLPKGMDFSAFLKAQKRAPFVDTVPVWQRAMDQNRFDHYARPFMQRFGTRCKIVDFAQLKQDPKGLAQEICAFAGAGASYFDRFDFEAQNVTSGLRSGGQAKLYYQLRAALVYQLQLPPQIMKCLRPLSQGVKHLLSQSGGDIPVPSISKNLDEDIRRAART